MAKMKLRAKLALSFSSLLLLIIVMVVLSFGNIVQIQTGLDNIVNLNVYKVNLIMDILMQIYNQSEAVQGVILASDPVTMEQERQKLAGAREKMKKTWLAMLKIATNDKEKNLLNSGKSVQLQNYVLADRIVELAMAGKKEEASELFIKKAKPAMAVWIKKNEVAIDLQVKYNQLRYDEALRASKVALTVMAIFSIIAILVGIFVTIFVTRSITKPINRIVHHLNGSAQQVAVASEQLSASAQQLSQGSTEQASSIEEISASMQESSSMLQQNNANTKQAVQLSEYAQDSADKGKQEMREMMDSMEEIRKSSDQIAKIIKVIDDIAFQTNILALNAAIEAARAGEAGLGFSVVAEEVRTLAQRSAQAARDTTAIIESNIQLSGQGFLVAERVRDALNEITAQVKKIRELMEEIAAASHEQTLGIEQVSTVVGLVETVAQQNAASSEESAAAAEELNVQTENLKKIVNDLSQMVNRVNVQKTELKFGVFHKMVDPDHTSADTKTADNAFHDIPLNNVNNKQTALADETGKTKVVSPEEVIPLEKDPHHF